jgi:pimeloyl-ACP methyl ester carboxylesterase
VWREAFEGFLEDDFADELDAIEAPTLLLWGDRDALVPRHDQDVALTTVPDAALIVYEGAGHAVHWEQPQRLASDLVAFVHEHVDAKLARLRLKSVAGAESMSTP